MKIILLAVTVCSSLLASPLAEAQQWATDEEMAGTGGSGGYVNGKSFFEEARMTVGMVRTSSSIDLANPKLPKPLAEIIELSFAQLEKFTGTREGWRVDAIDIHRPGKRVGMDAEYKKKWYYLVSFTDGAYGHASFPVTVDGRMPPIKVKKDQVQKSPLPF